MVVMAMKTNLITVPAGVSWLVGKLIARQQKRLMQIPSTT